MRHSESHLPEPLTEDAPRRIAASSNVRPFVWANLDALFRLDCAVRGRSPANPEIAVEAFRAALRLPRADPEKNVLVADCGGKPRGYVRLDPELNIGRVVAWLRVPAGTRGEEMAHALVEAAAARAREMGAPTLHVPVDHEQNRVHSAVLRAARMRVVRRQWRMQRPAIPADVLPVPEGLCVRPFEPGRDEPVLAELQNAVFSGSWGYSPNTAEEVKARLALPGHGPGGILFIEDSTGPVAYCWTGQGIDEQESAGAIHMMGVRPGHRGRGLGRLVAALGIGLISRQQACRISLEVDSANDAAVKLYRGLGFERVSDVLWYERSLTA